MSCVNNIHTYRIVMVLTNQYQCSKEELVDTLEVVEKALKRPINRHKYIKTWTKKQQRTDTSTAEAYLG